ncbi:MAG: hypothetical protein PHW46_00705 [Candidatus Omnitrophica bacterium]|nr:hypothetical protein [Candidatus Omnitrophota bacterium]
MKEKIKKMLKNKLAKDILVFFYQNQASIDSVGGVSAWVHKGRKDVHAVLEELVKLGVLVKDTQGSTKGYSYTRDKKVMEIIESLMGDGKKK